MGEAPTSSIFAMAVAPSLPMLLLLSLSSLTQMFFCKKSIKKTQLAAAKRAQKRRNMCIERFSLLAMGSRGTNKSRSAINTYREALGDFCPAFVGDLSVLGQIEAGQGLVDLKTRKRTKGHG